MEPPVQGNQGQTFSTGIEFGWDESKGMNCWEFLMFHFNSDIPWMKTPNFPFSNNFPGSWLFLLIWAPFPIKGWSRLTSGSPFQLFFVILCQRLHEILCEVLPKLVSAFAQGSSCNFSPALGWNPSFGGHTNQANNQFLSSAGSFAFPEQGAAAVAAVWHQGWLCHLLRAGNPCSSWLPVLHFLGLIGRKLQHSGGRKRGINQISAVCAGFPSLGCRAMIY